MATMGDFLTESEMGRMKSSEGAVEWRDDDLGEGGSARERLVWRWIQSRNRERMRTSMEGLFGRFVVVDGVVEVVVVAVVVVVVVVKVG
jgi:hypothetical protein